MQASPDEESAQYFAFVNFDKHEAAAAACKALHEKEIEGCKLYVDRAQTKAERQGILQRRHEQKRSQMAQLMEGKNLYVKNLAAAVDEESLQTAFSVCCVKTPLCIVVDISRSACNIDFQNALLISKIVAEVWGDIKRQSYA